MAPILAAVLRLCAVDANCAAPLPQAPPTTAKRAAPQQPPATPESTDTPPEAGDEDALVRSRRFSRWNEFDGKWASIRFGAGYLVDYGAYDQDAAGEQQMPDLETGFKMRDFRMLFKGRLKFPGRKVTWSAGFMYDNANHAWLVRQTGISFETPGITGSIFVGRQKEGFSMSKIMVGYHGWGMERMPMNDSSVQLLADGVKWTGYASRQHVTWNVGALGTGFQKTSRSRLPIASSSAAWPGSRSSATTGAISCTWAWPCDMRSPTTASCSRGHAPKRTSRRTSWIPESSGPSPPP